MAFKWTEGNHRAGNILDVDEFNGSFNNFKGEINGGLDRENLPNSSVSNDELDSTAFVKYAVKKGIRIQNTGLYTATYFSDNGFPTDPAFNQPFRSINYNTYSGGWKTNEAQKMNKLFQEGMLHIEYNGWYWLRNHLATDNSGRSPDALQIWCQFELTLDGNPVVTSGRHYQNVGQIHLVADVPISTMK